jgi:PAS domain S-box-containing protein
MSRGVSDAPAPVARAWWLAARYRPAAIVLLVVALCVGGFLLTTHAVNTERRATARSQAQDASQQTRSMLERAGTYATGLSNALAGEPTPNARRFDDLVGSATATVALPDAMWVERVPAGGRREYERRIGAPITSLPRTKPAGKAAAYLPATFVTGLPLHAGTDTSSLAALTGTLANPASAFAGTATSQATVAGQPGFFLVQEAQFGHGPGSHGYLVVFVPAGWLDLAGNVSPSHIAISLEGRHLTGTLSGKPLASEGFEALTRDWRVDVAEPPKTALQTLLPRLALAWPLALALLVYLATRGIRRRRYAEREVDDIFDLSLDPLCVMSVEGYLTRVNPAFSRTLGYDDATLVAHRVREFAHPDDREKVGAAIDKLRAGTATESFEGRFVRADGAVRWLTWNMRTVLDRGLMYGAAYDVTRARGLLEEQAALRRVATLVAKGGSADELFTAVAAEVGVLVGAHATRLLRFEQDGTTSVVAAHGASDAQIGISAGEDHDDGEVWRQIAQRETAAFAENGDKGLPSLPNGPLSPAIGSAFAAPIVVSGQPWGVIVAAWRDDEPEGQVTEARLEQFTELVATAVANAEGRSELAESRRRVVTAADEARRRIERDLHDGAQQRLVHGIITLKLAQRRLGADPADAAGLVDEALETTERANEELRELARGIHPAVLSRGGLAAALGAVAERSPIPVSLDVESGDRLPTAMDVTIYFVVSEALVNVAKHSRASAVEVTVGRLGGQVRVSIGDDGVGGADPARGSGLVGLKDRVEAVGGTLTIHSPPGAGTLITAELPLAGHQEHRQDLTL